MVAKHDIKAAESATKATMNLIKKLGSPKSAMEMGNEFQSAAREAVSTAIDARKKSANKDYGLAEDLSEGQPVIGSTNITTELRSIIQEYSSSDADDAMAIVKKAKQMLTKRMESVWSESGGMRTVDAAVHDKSFYGSAAAGTGNIFKDISPRLDRRIAGRLFSAATDDLYEASGDDLLGQALKKANDNYRDYTASIKGIEGSVLGKMMGKEFTDAADVFNIDDFNSVAGETIFKKMQSMPASDIKTAMGYLNKNNPDVASGMKATILQGALDVGMDTSTIGRHTFKMSTDKFRKAISKIGDDRLKAYGFSDKELKDLNQLVDEMSKIGDYSSQGISGLADVHEAYRRSRGGGTFVQKVAGVVATMFGGKYAAKLLLDPKRILELKDAMKPNQTEEQFIKSADYIIRLAGLTTGQSIAEDIGD